MTQSNGSMISHRWIGSISLSVLLAAACVSGLAGMSAAADKPKQEVSRVIAKEMTAAQKALAAQQWAEAIKNLDAAEQKSGLTTFDKKTIDDFRGFAYIKLNNLKSAQTNYEAAMATGGYTPEEAAQTIKKLFRISASNQQYPKAIEYGKQMAEAGNATSDDLGLISQLYYLQKDCKNSGAWTDKAVAAARKAGEPVKENWFQFKLQCASDAGDTPGMIPVLVDLIRLTNKTTYWNDLLRIERQDERDDHNTLMLYRVMFNTNSMTEGSDYIEMSQLLGDAALPGEAFAVLDKAMSTGLIKPEQKERTTRLLNSLKARADTDRKGLPQEEADAAKSASGELGVKLGEVEYGFGDYQKTVDAITAALQKGQIKHQDEAYVYLGLAQVQLKNNAEAKKAFANLKNVPNISPRVLKLYDLYGATLS
jgi:tetratricopeptide (TPR) repeat protein